MDERGTGAARTRREEIAGRLEELAGEVRSGALAVEGADEAREPARSRVKSKSKDGRRRLRLEFEWPESEGHEKPRKRDKKSGKSGRNEKDGKKPVKEAAGAAGKSRGVVRDHDSHVLVCKGGDCSKKGGQQTKRALKNGLRAEGMNGSVRVDSVQCLGLCKQGPNVIVYPEGSWYLGLKERDAPEVVEKHLKNGEPVERLTAERIPPKQTKQTARSQASKR